MARQQTAELHGLNQLSLPAIDEWSRSVAACRLAPTDFALLTYEHCSTLSHSAASYIPGAGPHRVPLLQEDGVGVLQCFRSTATQASHPSPLTLLLFEGWTAPLIVATALIPFFPSLLSFLDGGPLGLSLIRRFLLDLCLTQILVPRRDTPPLSTQGQTVSITAEAAFCRLPSDLHNSQKPWLLKAGASPTKRTTMMLFPLNNRTTLISLLMAINLTMIPLLNET